MRNKGRRREGRGKNSDNIPRRHGHQLDSPNSPAVSRQTGQWILAQTQSSAGPARAPQ